MNTLSLFFFTLNFLAFHFVVANLFPIYRENLLQTFIIFLTLRSKSRDFTSCYLVFCIHKCFYFASIIFNQLFRKWCILNINTVRGKLCNGALILLYYQYIFSIHIEYFVLHAQHLNLFGSKSVKKCKKRLVLTFGSCTASKRKRKTLFCRIKQTLWKIGLAISSAKIYNDNEAKCEVDCKAIRP